MSSMEFGWAYDQKVEPVAKLALLLMADNAHDFSVAFTVRWLVRRMHCKPAVARAALKRLERKNLIFCEEIGGTCRVRLKTMGEVRIPDAAVLT